MAAAIPRPRASPTSNTGIYESDRSLGFPLALTAAIRHSRLKPRRLSSSGLICLRCAYTASPCRRPRSPEGTESSLRSFSRICRSEDKDPFRVQEKEISAGDSPGGYAILILSAAGREDFHLLKEKSLWRHALP